MNCLERYALRFIRPSSEQRRKHSDHVQHINRGVTCPLPTHCSTSNFTLMVLLDVVSFAVIAVGLSSRVIACPDDGHGQSHFHAPARKAALPVPLPIPKRPLEWGDVNILHTTDTHGWLLGHQKTSPPEPNYRLGLMKIFAS